VSVDVTPGTVAGAAVEVPVEVPGRGVRLRYALRTPTVLDWLAFAWIAVLVLAVVSPGLIAHGDPLRTDDAAILRSPSSAHLLGTDYLGRDMWARLVHGTVRTLTGSAVAVVIGLGIGTVLGLLAAYFIGPVDSVISRLTDVLLSIPGLLLCMVVVVSLGFGSLNAAIAVGVATISVFTRLMRSEVLTVKGLTFVEASRHLGGGSWHVLRRHVLPNAYGAVLSLTALQFGLAILWVSALSFLGYGAPPPQPEWGRLIAEGRTYMVSSPWLVFAPGLFIVVSVLTFSRLAQFAKERLG
jgi:peptide/nickel transport system permease protein